MGKQSLKEKSIYNIGIMILSAYCLSGFLALVRVPFVRISPITNIVSLLVLFIIAVFVALISRSRLITRISGIKHMQSIAILLILTGVCSTVMRCDQLAEVAYCALWGMNIWIVWFFASSVVSCMSAKALDRLFISLATLFLLICIVCESLYGSNMGRFTGVLYNPTWTARFLALIAVICTAKIMVSQNASFADYIVCLVSLLLLVMTKTRASISACVLGSIVAATIIIVRERGVVVRRALCCITIVGALVLISLILESGGGFRPSVYLRNITSYNSLVTARGANWSSGISNIPKHGVFGGGFMSKYDKHGELSNVYGMRIPTYNWQTDADPLNTPILVSKQIGWVGGILVIVLYVSIVITAYSHRNYIVLAVGICGVVWGSCDGNWALSINDGFDRVSVLFIVASIHLMRPNDLRTSSNPG